MLNEYMYESKIVFSQNNFETMVLCQLGDRIQLINAINIHKIHAGYIPRNFTVDQKYDFSPNPE